MNSFRQLLIIINLKTLVVMVLAVASTYLCRRFEIFADFPMTLIATAVVFPIVFSINGAYKRRESALAKYGSIKAHGRGLFWAARDWLTDDEDGLEERARVLMGELLVAARTLFTQPVDEMAEREAEVYRSFSKLSEFINKDLRKRGLPSGEASRCNQFLSKMVIAFEDIKHIYQYRTPRTLRAFSNFFVRVLPIIYGPYFASTARDYSPGLAYVMPVLFTAILVSLDNIQEHLENPFDQVGADDVVINAEKYVERLGVR